MLRELIVACLLWRAACAFQAPFRPQSYTSWTPWRGLDRVPDAITGPRPSLQVRKCASLPPPSSSSDVGEQLRDQGFGEEFVELPNGQMIGLADLFGEMGRTAEGERRARAMLMEVFAEYKDMSRDEALALVGLLALWKLPPDLELYHALLRAHLKAMLPRGRGVPVFEGTFFSIISLMQQDGVTPTAATFNILMKLYAVKGDVGGAKDIIKDMQMGVFPAKPDSRTYLYAMQACSKLWENALDVLRMAEEAIGPSPQVLMALVKTCNMADRHTDVQDLLRPRMPWMRSSTYMQVYDSAFSSFRKSKDTPAALWLLAQMVEHGPPPCTSHVNQVMAQCIADGDPAAAAKLMQALLDGEVGPEAKPDLRSYVLAIKANCRVGGLAAYKAKALHEEMERSYSVDEPSSEHLGMLAELLALTHYDPRHEVDTVFERVLRGRVALPRSPAVYASFIHAYKTLEAWDRVEALSEEAKRRLEGRWGVAQGV